MKASQNIKILKNIKAEIEYAKCEYWREEIRALRTVIRFLKGETMGRSQLEMELNLIKEIKFSWERCFKDEIAKEEIKALKWTIQIIENCLKE